MRHLLSLSSANSNSSRVGGYGPYSKGSRPSPCTSSQSASALAASRPYPMSSDNFDHSNRWSLDHSSEPRTPRTDCDEVDLLDDDLIGWLPLIAANDFLE